MAAAPRGLVLLGVCAVLMAFTVLCEAASVVVGTAKCADCTRKNMKAEDTFKGLQVAIKCKNGAGEYESKAAGKLDGTGAFSVPLDAHLDSSDCIAQLHSAGNKPFPGNEPSKIVPVSEGTFVAIATETQYTSVMCSSATICGIIKKKVMDHFHKKPVPSKPDPKLEPPKPKSEPKHPFLEHNQEKEKYFLDHFRKKPVSPKPEPNPKPKTQPRPQLALEYHTPTPPQLMNYRLEPKPEPPKLEPEPENPFLNHFHKKEKHFLNHFHKKPVPPKPNPNPEPKPQSRPQPVLEYQKPSSTQSMNYGLEPKLKPKHPFLDHFHKKVQHLLNHFHKNPMPPKPKSNLESKPQPRPQPMPEYHNPTPPQLMNYGLEPKPEPSKPKPELEHPFLDHFHKEKHFLDHFHKKTVLPKPKPKPELEHPFLNHFHKKEKHLLNHFHKKPVPLKPEPNPKPKPQPRPQLAPEYHNPTPPQPTNYGLESKLEPPKPKPEPEHPFLHHFHKEKHLLDHFHKKPMPPKPKPKPEPKPQAGPQPASEFHNPSSPQPMNYGLEPPKPKPQPGHAFLDHFHKHLFDHFAA